MDVPCLSLNRAFRIDQGMKNLIGDNAIPDPNSRYLKNSVIMLRMEARSLGIKYHIGHECSF